MPQTRRPTALHLAEENWGERMRRAYRTARDTYGKEEITYRRVATKIKKLKYITDATLNRLEEYEAPPRHPGVRLNAYLALIAYGYNPTEFDLDTSGFPEWAKDWRKVSDQLRPSSARTTYSADSAA